MYDISQAGAGHRPAALRSAALQLLSWPACVAVGLVMHFFIGPAIGEYPAGVMKQVGVFVVAAVSLTIVNGFTGQFSMGHAGFMAIGGYIAAAVTYYASLYTFGDTALREGLFTTAHWFMLGGLLLGALVAAGFGYIVGLPSLRLRGDYLAIVTLGFGEIVRVLLQQTTTQVFDAATLRENPLQVLIRFPLNGSTGFEGVPPYASNFWVWTIAALTCVVAFRVKFSSGGRALLSIREDEIAARAMGVNLTKYKVRAFVLAAFFGGVAGGLLAHVGVPFSPTDAGFLRSFEIIIMVVLGGLGSISGAVLAAIILTILPEVLRDFAQYRLIIYALVLILTMIVRPKGLLGVYEIWELFRPTGRGADRTGEPSK